MDAAYLRAAHPEPFTILGKNLKPFGLGHELLLQRFGNRFSLENDWEENPPQIADLLTGVYICSQPYSQAVSLDNFSIPIRVRIFSAFRGVSYLIDRLLLFRKYILSHTELPQVVPTRENGNSGRTGAPTIQSVKVSLMERLKMTSDQALNVSFSLAFWDHFTWAESQGSVLILSEEEMEMQRADAKLAANNEERLKRWAAQGVAHA